MPRAVRVHGDLKEYRARARYRAEGTTPIKVCQEQNNAKQLARDWREIFAVRKIADEKISFLSYSSDRDEICLGEGWRIVEYVCAHAAILRKQSA